MSFKEDTKRAFELWRAQSGATIKQKQWERDILSRHVYEILRIAAVAEEERAQDDDV